MNSAFRGDNVSRLLKNYTKYIKQEQKFISDKNRGEYYGGVPLGYIPEEGAIYVDSQDSHTIVYGATGSLKTRSIVMPTIKILADAGESMIINDCKGELYERLANELRKKSYNIITINLREPSTGNAWNPLHIPYEFYVKGDIDKAAEFANDIANNLMANDKSNQDPFWDCSSADLLFGLILALFKYCKDHGMGENAVNISNVLTLKRKLFEQVVAPQNQILWKYLSEDELIEASMSGTVYAPNDTRKSILSVFDQHMRTFVIQPTMMEMLANHDFNIAAFDNEKTAIFIITPDEKTSYHRLVSLFIKQSYEYLIYLAGQNDNKIMKRRINYILDEFSALPAIADMQTMISAARSRNIRFLLVVQSKASLKRKYAEDAETIVGNCSNVIFFTSREIDLLKELSDMCGDQKINQPNISIYELQHLSKEKSEALVICGRCEPAIVHMADIDKLVSKKTKGEKYTKGRRQEKEILTFELAEDIKKSFSEEEDILKEISTDSFLKIPTFEEFLAMRKKKAAEEKESRQEGIDNDGE